MIDVCCAIIRNEEAEVLVVQRAEDTDHPLEWEFPGGKIRKQESPENGIIREIDEELAMDIIIIDSLEKVEYDYGIKQVRLFPLVCDTLSDDPVLTEHADFKWLRPSELENLNLCLADVIVARQYLETYGEAEAEILDPEDSVTDAQSLEIKEMLSVKGGYNACDVLAENIIRRPALLKLLINYSLSGNAQLAFRASYCISKAEEKSPGVSENFYGLFAESLQKLNKEPVIRAFLKILNNYDFRLLSEKHRGIIADCCFGWLNSSESAVAIKVYSMNSLYKLSLIYPELLNELKSSVVQAMEEGSAGIKARGRHILKLLD